MTSPGRRLFALLLWLPGLLILGTGLAILPADPAAAATGDVLDIHSDGETLSFVLASGDLPEGASIQTDNVEVKLQGEVVPETAEPANVARDRPKRRAVLTIDISGSMNQGNRLDAAKEAAFVFLDAVSDDVEVGLVVFNGTVSVLVNPTTNRDQVREQVAALGASGGTALYQAVIESLNVLGPDGVRSLVLLSDGQNDAPAIPTMLEDASAAVQGAQNGDLDVTVVAIAPDPEFLAPLRGLTGAAGPRGRLIPAERLEQVTETFAEAAETINQQVLVTVPIPEGFTGGDITIDVSAMISDGTRITARRTFPLPPVAAPVEPTTPPDYGPKPVALPSFPIGQEILPVALVAIFAGGATILAIAFLSAARTDTVQGRISRRLSLYTLTGRQPQKQAETSSTSVFGSSAIVRSAVELAGRVVATPKVESALAARLDSAGLLLRPAEWTLIHIATTLFGGLLFLLLSGGGILATLLGLALGIVGPHVYLVLQRSRREDAFLAQLPETLQLMAGSLSVGYSLSQAVDTVVREGSQPVSGEFNRALVQSRLGMPVEDALEAVARRFRSKDMTWAVMAIRIQRKVGGNLAEVLSNVAGTLRERERLHRQVRVLSAEGRLSAWILGALPVAFTLYLVLVRPEYLEPLYTTAMGWLFTVVACVLFIVGVLWLSKVVKVQV